MSPESNQMSFGDVINESMNEEVNQNNPDGVGLKVLNILDAAIRDLDKDAKFVQFMLYCAAQGVIVKPNIRTVRGKHPQVLGISYELEGHTIQASILGERYMDDALFGRFGGEKTNPKIISAIRAITKECEDLAKQRHNHDAKDEEVKSSVASPSQEMKEEWLNKAIKIGRILKFKFSVTPSFEFLKSALIDFVKNKGSGIFKTDDSPTGTGKSWAISEALAYIVSRLQKGSNVILLAPENRHLQSIANDLDGTIDPNFRGRIVRLRRNEEAIIDHPIPTDCPLREKSGDNVPKEEIGLNNSGKIAIKALETCKADLEGIFEKKRNVAKSHIERPSNRNHEIEAKALDSAEDEIIRRMKEGRDSLKHLCKKKITAMSARGDKCSTCSSCYTMFPGNAIHPNDTPNIVVATYQKFVRGFGAFEIKNRKASFFQYSPFSKYSHGQKRGIFKNFILMEEASQGHRIISGIIEDEAKNLSVLDAAHTLHASLNSAARMVLANLHHEDRDIYDECEADILLTISNAKKKIEEYYFTNKSCTPFKTIDGGIQLKNNGGSNTEGVKPFTKFVASLSSGFTSLFTSVVAGVKTLTQKSYSKAVADQVIADLELFNSTKSMRDAQYEPLTVAINLMLECAIKPSAQITKSFKRASMKMAQKNADAASQNVVIDFGDQFLSYFKKTNFGETEISAGGFIEILLQRIDRKFESHKEDDSSILTQFYREGYEFIEAREGKYKTVDVILRVSNGSPEGMVENLRYCKNDIYASSASANINSVLTNFDMEWLENKSGPITLIPREDITAALREKIDGKKTPEVIWSDNSLPKIIDITTSETKSLEEAENIKSTLNSLAASLHNGGSPAPSPRFAIVFVNDLKTMRRAITTFNEFGRSTLAGGALDNENCLKCFEVTAEEFKNGKVDAIRGQFVNHLLGTDPLNYFIVFTTYPSMKTGANMHVDLPYVPDTDKNFWRYVGNNIIRQHEGAGFKVSVDISDLVLCEPLSMVVNEENVWRVAHQLFAIGDIDWMVASHHLLNKGGDKKSNFMRTSALVKRTEHYIAAQIDDINQAAGRMDRTLNSSASPKLFISESLLKIFTRMTPSITEKMVLPPAMDAIKASSWEFSYLRPMQEFDDTIYPLEMTCREFQKEMSSTFRRKPNSRQARAAWEKMREHFTRYQAVYTDNLEKTQEGKELSTYLSAYDNRLSVEDLYFKIPADMPKAASKGSETISIAWTQIDNKVVFREPDHPIDCKINTLTAKRYPKKPSKSVYILRPSLYADIAMAANFENHVEHLLKSWVKVDVLSATQPLEDGERIVDMEWLFERADIFVPSLDLAIDAKMYSHLTMSLQANQPSIENLVRRAQKKLCDMSIDAPDGKWYPKRYVYAFRNGFGKMQLEAYFKGDTQVSRSDDWDVAFVDAQLHETLRKIKQVIQREKE